MSIFISIPTILRTFTDNKKTIELNSDESKIDVNLVLQKLEQMFPGISQRICAKGRMHAYMNIYVNDEDIRFMKDLDTQVKDGDNLIILPAVAGG